MITFIRNNPVKLIVSLVILVLASLLILTADPKGYCSGKAFNGKTGVYLTDEEFVIWALKTGFVGKLFSDQKLPTASEEEAKKYLAQNPDCCEVYRHSTYYSGGIDVEVHSSLFDRAFWHRQSVVVRVRDLDELQKLRQGHVEVEEVNFLHVSTCGVFLGKL